MPPYKYLTQAIWTWSSICPSLFIPPLASVCHAVRLGLLSGLHSVWFKIDDLFWAVLKGIKQQAFMEFLMRENEAPVEIHEWLLAFCGADTVDVSTVCHCVRKWKDSGRNVDQPQSGMPVCATQDLNRWKVDELFWENWQIFSGNLSGEVKNWFNNCHWNYCRFGFKKIVCAWWVVCHHMPKMKRTKLEACLGSVVVN